MSRYCTRLGHLRFWKRFFQSFFAAVGLIAFIIGLFGLLYPDFFKAKLWIVASVGAAALLWASWAERPRLPRQRYSHTTVRLVVGDLFAQDDANVLIGMSSTFDTTVADGIIALDSVQGKFLDRIYAGSSSKLDADLDAALAKASVQSIATIDKPGKQAVYPISTVATLSSTNAKKYFCVAYTDMDIHNVAHGTIQGVLDGLNAVWDACDRHGNGAPICVPIIGQG